MDDQTQLTPVFDNDKWQVVVAENHSMTRLGLRVTLESLPDFEVVAEASTGNQSVELCRTLRPDIVLMDINMPDGNGIEATKVIHRLYPNIIIIAYSAYMFDELQRDIMRAGAAGFISKETDFSDVGRLIRVIISRAPTPPLKFRMQFGLTRMEYLVLLMLAEGANRKAIAQRFNISINTTKMHLRNLYSKLSVSSAKEAVKLALEHQLLG